MSRIRSIKPGFFLDDDLAELAPLTRILFAGLWCIADREGRLEDRPKRIKAEVLPYDDHDIDKALQQLHEKGFIIRYEAEGSRYIQVTNFTKHQSPNIKEQASTIPAPYMHDTCTSSCARAAGAGAESGFMVLGSSAQQRAHAREEMPEPAASSPVLPRALNEIDNSFIQQSGIRLEQVAILFQQGYTFPEIQAAAGEVLARGKGPPSNWASYLPSVMNDNRARGAPAVNGTGPPLDEIEAMFAHERDIDVRRAAINEERRKRARAEKEHPP